MVAADEDAVVGADDGDRALDETADCEGATVEAPGESEGDPTGPAALDPEFVADADGRAAVPDAATTGSTVEVKVVVTTACDDVARPQATSSASTPPRPTTLNRARRDTGRELTGSTTEMAGTSS